MRPDVVARFWSKVEKSDGCWNWRAGVTSEPVTVRENLLRGLTLTAANARKTHCPQGHPHSPENTKLIGNANRVCRICHRATHRRWRIRRQQRAAGIAA